MQFNFFKSLFYKLSSFVDNLQKSFEDKEKKASQNPLYQSFNLYAKEDLKLALDLIKNGYQPTKLQKENLDRSLINNAIKNGNFIFNYGEFIEFIPQQAFINYCLYHDLSDKCKNEKTVFVNFEHFFKRLAQQEGFSEQLYQQLKSSIFNLSVKCASIKPKYESIHSFEFNQIEYALYDRFTANIYNSLVLIPYMVNSMDKFISLRTTIEQSVEKIRNHVQSHNVEVITYEGRIIHSHKNTCKLFKIELLNNWVNYIQKYDTSSLQKNLIDQIKKQEVSNKVISEIEEAPSKDNVNIFNNNLEEKINQVKELLSSSHKEQIERIQLLYLQIHSDMFEKKQHYELDNLYKDLPQVMEKFISIHPEYRETLKNVEGKSPEELMVESLNTIENKFKEYWEDINQNKVTDLSIVQRGIKMKA